jgi:hypothetical protein
LPEQSPDRREAIICAREIPTVVSTQFRIRAEAMCGRMIRDRPRLRLMRAGNPALPCYIGESRWRGKIMNKQGDGARSGVLEK